MHSDKPLSNARILTAFFELYGGSFNYSKLAIAINRGTIIPISKIPSSLARFENMNTLVVVDPADVENNIARSTYRFTSLLIDWNQVLLDFVKAQKLWHEKKIRPDLMTLLGIDQDVIKKARAKSSRCMYQVDRIVGGLGLDVFNLKHLDQVDAFLKPSRDDFYDDGREIELDPSSSESDYYWKSDDSFD